MKTLFLDCSSGAAGNMLAGALLELIPQQEKFLREINSVGFIDVEFKRTAVTKNGITGTLFTSEPKNKAMRGHRHFSMSDIERLVNGLEISDEVRNDVMAVYGIIAQAESHVHGVPINEVHFHEVGSADAVADITAVCTLINMLKPEKVVANHVHVGSGTVNCAHGVLSVPAPATAFIVRDIPTYGGAVKGELCTPTGAALLKHFVSVFTQDPPELAAASVGCGVGTKSFAGTAGYLRAVIGKA